jgi:hypothetical protein
MNPALCYKDRPCGAVAQLGERLNGIQEVDGSIPFGSTIFLASAALQPRPEKRHGVVQSTKPDPASHTSLAIGIAIA